MAEKKPNRRNSPEPKKKRSRTASMIAVLLVAIAIGVGAKMMGGDESAIPPPKTAGGKIVVLEFFDYG